MHMKFFRLCELSMYKQHLLVYLMAEKEIAVNHVWLLESFLLLNGRQHY